MTDCNFNIVRCPCNGLCLVKCYLNLHIDITLHSFFLFSNHSFSHHSPSLHPFHSSIPFLSSAYIPFNRPLPCFSPFRALTLDPSAFCRLFVSTRHTPIFATIVNFLLALKHTHICDLWSGSVMVMALDSRLGGSGCESRPFRFQVTTLGRLFKHTCACYQAV